MPTEPDDHRDALDDEDLAVGSDERNDALFRRLPDPAAREELVSAYFPLVEYLARRFNGRGEPLDDLIQVASIGLLKAIDRFETERGVKFSTYAVPTIVGELKRHFRDTGWALRVPRRLQERSLQLRAVIADLGQERGRSPTIAEIATRTGMTEEEVLEASEVLHASSVESLDAPILPGEGSTADSLGDEDETIEFLEGWADVAPLLRTLPDRERRLLYLRFVRDMSQGQIAQLLGISQMHVSRLLARALAKLRSQVGTDQGS